MEKSGDAEGPLADPGADRVVSVWCLCAAGLIGNRWAGPAGGGPFNHDNDKDSQDTSFIVLPLFSARGP